MLMIVVHWGDVGPTLRLIESAGAVKRSTELHLLVVSNDPAEEHFRKLRLSATGMSTVEVIQSTANRGYFGGANMALEHYSVAHGELPDWVIVSNNDVVIEDDAFLEKLLNLDLKEVGVLAPRIQGWPGNLDQNPFMRHRPGRLRWAQLRIVSSYYPLAAIWDWLWRRKTALRSWLAARRAELLRNKETANREPIYAGHGSFFIFSRRYFEAGGYLDGNLFLYGEEISVAEICRSLGLPVTYEPSLRVIHREHQSTGKILSRFTYDCQKKALQYLTCRYFSGSEKAVDSCQPEVP